MKAREQRRIVFKGFLIASEVNDEGFREVIDFTVADGESETASNEFFLSLKERGLEEVDLVTRDDHGGLTKAIRKHFYGASWQHCQTHFFKNMLDERFDEITAVYSLPEPYRKRLRTSSSIERLNEELRRRERIIQKHPSHGTNVLGGVFPGGASMIRLMGSVLMEIREMQMMDKNSFTKEPYEADKEEARKALQLDRDELNH